MRIDGPGWKATERATRASVWVVMLAGMMLPPVARAQTSSLSTPSVQSLTPGSTSASVSSQGSAPAQYSEPPVGNIPTKILPVSTDTANIDALRFRSDISSPSVMDTVLDNYGGWRSQLADYGIGLNGFFSATPSVNLLNQPQSTYGTHRYIGQEPEFDTSNNYLALTYDTRHIGLPGGLVTLMGCDQASTNGTYGHNAHLCQAYYDQQLFMSHVDVQIGIINESFQYQNPFVGGSLSSGTLGPSSNVAGELGLSAVGVGAPAINVSMNVDNYYVRLGAARSASVRGTVYDNQVGNPYGIRFNDPGAGVLYLQEVGYRTFSFPGRLSTWIRINGFENTSEYPTWRGGKSSNYGLSVYADQQFLQPDPAKPRRGLYGGVAYTWADPDIVTYAQYYELRVYDVGPFASRPGDQAAFIGDMTVNSPGYLHSLRRAHYGTAQDIFNFTADYTFHLTAGVFLSGGLTYAVHPSAIHDDEEGDPLLFRAVLAVYF